MLKEQFGFANDLDVPTIQKITINVGLSRNFKEKEFVDEVQSNLATITGQRPILTKARKSVSSFKIRTGMLIGAKVTLRGKRMYDFVEKLIHIVYPRVRDFRGIPEKAVDDKGNISLGFTDIMAFPEIEAQNVNHSHGLEVCITTSASNKEEGLELFRLLGFPFKESMKTPSKEDNKKE